MAGQYLLLKWGTLKGWGGLEENKAAMGALRRYHSGPTSVSAMEQRDTQRQKEALLDLIDAVDGEIVNDWSGEHLTKDAAREYVQNYGEGKAA